MLTKTIIGLMLGSTRLIEVLQAVGELLGAQGEEAGIIVVGGASLNLLGFVVRTTSDVDIIAFAQHDENGFKLYPPPDPLPTPLRRAIEIVARDFGLPSDWMNTEIASQWSQGLPPELATDLIWHQYSGLKIGLAGRRTLITLKLFAAVDTGPGSVHYQDLLALDPDNEELRAAARWVNTQDATVEFSKMVDQVIKYVLRDNDRGNS